ncbi:uncharacterized protein LOC110858401 [Folsomia candida]|uniref:Uncharacterized protein n=1 Tax=Folsomia candida TaxID=158441 RepID=A0A226DES7_FOLCA|nr:uncharacterized protein LOC110858401 [Folsomia candida]OXA43693.1 hypothetical protein Fcan01_21628 [Folsomia candida]
MEQNTHAFTFLLFLAAINGCAGLTLFPEPAGPFYGFPYSTNVARRFPIPSSAYGKCQAGKSYTINSFEDLRKHEAELQCIFSAGLTPSKVPEGPQPGRVLLALNARHFLINPIVRLIWRGNFAFKAECNSTSGSEASQIYVGFHNSFNNVAVLPTIVYIAPLQANFAPGECEDGKPSAIMDFTQNLRTICPDYAEFVRRNKDKLPTSVTSLANFYPNTQILDVFRLVGRQSDGGRIFLGKTYFRDAFRSDKQIATIAFWYTLSYDDQVNPDFGVGENLPPLEYSYDYMFPGVVDIVFRYLPFDNFLSRPFATLGNLGRGARVLLTNTYHRIRDYIRRLGSRRADRRKLRQYFQDVRQARRSYVTTNTKRATRNSSSITLEASTASNIK